MKIFFALAVCLAGLTGFSPPLLAQDATPFDDNAVKTEVIQEQINEIGRELTDIVLENIQNYLDDELERLKKHNPKVQEALEKQAADYDRQLDSKPNDAQTHFNLGELRDEMDDGANAIVHMQKAEELYKNEKNIQGLAKARRSLRAYYKKYDFKPEDFNLKAE